MILMARYLMKPAQVSLSAAARAALVIYHQHWLNYHVNVYEHQ